MVLGVSKHAHQDLSKIFLKNFDHNPTNWRPKAVGREMQRLPCYLASFPKILMTAQYPLRVIELTQLGHLMMS